jgi:hypothetical protein
MKKNGGHAEDGYNKEKSTFRITHLTEEAYNKCKAIIEAYKNL